ncbi:hypothetical protein [Myroides odoratimimus]|uniref:hypothetical protein n=1 Tax=Myroides odoratimimus TaxID=76832 RepID=UPI001CE1E298|nr:hypothetical protein [Myroides odoratimimus]MCA4806455.1 hypothetical protein [Myroides odoratimimus]MDM1530839.1 hypothetical protein [Myroides odoratimimus]
MNNNLPKVVLFQDDEVSQVYDFMLPYNLGTNTKIKSIDYDLIDFQNTYTIIGNKNASTSDVYFLHPYKENTYVEQSIAENYLIEEKIALYGEIASLLGATKVNSFVKFEEAREYLIDANGNMKYNVIEVDVKYKEQQESKYSKSIEIADTYIQADNFDLNRNLDHAYALVEKYNLSHEVQLKSLVEGRDSRRSGMLQKTKRIKTELTSEINSLYEASVKINSPIFTVNANLKESMKKVSRLSVELEFIFDE